MYSNLVVSNKIKRYSRHIFSGVCEKPQDNLSHVDVAKYFAISRKILCVGEWSFSQSRQSTLYSWVTCFETSPWSDLFVLLKKFKTQ